MHHHIQTSLITNSQGSFTALAASDILLQIYGSSSGTSDQTANATSLLADAVDWAERGLQLDLRTCTYTLQLDRFPSALQANYWAGDWNNWILYPGTVGRSMQSHQQIYLLRGPLVSLDSITYFDTNNTQQTLDPSTYAYVKPSYFPAYLEPVQVWPIAYSRPDAVSINFHTGLSVVPPMVLRAIKLKCGELNANREGISFGPSTAVGLAGDTAEKLLNAYRVIAVG